MRCTVRPRRRALAVLVAAAGLAGWLVAGSPAAGVETPGPIPDSRVLGSQVPGRAPDASAHVPIPGGLGGRTCFECHLSGVGEARPAQEQPRRYSLAEAFETYLESPHGRLRRLGDQRAPMCEDCHLTREWKEILPREHPDSPIHPRNLPDICARCHGEAMRTANVTEGSMHLELSGRSLVPGGPLDVKYGFLPGLTKTEGAYYLGPIDVMAYVSVFFLLITVGTLLSFSVYLVIDLRRKLIERREARQAAGPGGGAPGPAAQARQSADPPDAAGPPGGERTP